MAAMFEHAAFDCIVHLAARAGVRPSLSEPKLYSETNINGTLNLLELARDHRVPQFVFGSSSSVYGINGPRCPSLRRTLSFNRSHPMPRRRLPVNCCVTPTRICSASALAASDSSRFTEHASGPISPFTSSLVRSGKVSLSDVRRRLGPA